ncbi:MAG: sialate O-acetylesterase, partial [Phycisphaerae bacterium]
MARKTNAYLLVSCSILVLSLGCLRAGAAVRFASIFSDHMVLQRGMADPVWGMGTPGQMVKVTFAGHTVSGQANNTGHWMVRLPAMQANA